jgi:DNA-binding beta-propeller fold protein YncE
MQILNKDKAYITDLYAEQIAIVNPNTYQITGAILTPGHASTEQMVKWNDFLFVSCWSFDNTILVIDTRTDAIVGEIKTGKQPGGLVLDKYNKIWTLCDGGWSKSGTTPRTPMLQQIDPATRTIEKSFSLTTDAKPSRLAINGTRDSLLFINDGIWKMGVNQTTMGDRPFLSTANHLYYSLAIDPLTSELYLSDAIDYMQRGVVYRYSPLGAKIDSFKTGIIPGSFCFK